MRGRRRRERKDCLPSVALRVHNLRHPLPNSLSSFALSIPTPVAILLGAHTIDNGGIDMAARRAGAAKMTALQIFSAVPKYYNDKVSVKPERVARFRAALDEAGI